MRTELKEEILAISWCSGPGSSKYESISESQPIKIKIKPLQIQILGRSKEFIGSSVVATAKKVGS